MPDNASPQPNDASTERWRFWIDRGGTFTDVLARRPDGRLLTRKLLSEDPAHYDDAVLTAVRGFLELGDGTPIPAGAIDELRLGTTVATNALLERKGARTALLITRGFGDLLTIGDQSRPQIFALRIDKPAPLAEQIVEIDERVDVDGTVQRGPHAGRVQTQLRALKDAGIEAVAIAFVHGAQYPQHELEVAAIARHLGFEHVCCSHEVSALPGLLSRTQTAVLDAYLRPRLLHYIRHLAQALPGARLRFMQSSGGLIGMDCFHARNSVLSGPAGGVIGAVRCCAALGRGKVIGFDMGGTSTDVFHYAGALEQREESLLAGQRLRTPMLQIHTVAAGGGSVLSFDGSRLQVGPASAGADPGPVCYRRGGPLAVTDANLLLGRIQATHFPAVFGPAANEPLSPEAVRDAFTQRAAEIANATGQTSTAEAIAWGYLQIAVENMANAIRRVSVERGIHVGGYSLCAFGGAGGQHACAVADALGMREIVLHDQAGLLSALGIGISDLSHRGEQAIDEVLTPAVVPLLITAEQALQETAIANLSAQGISPEQIQLHAHVTLRYEGADTTLQVPPGNVAAMRQAFVEQHRTLFGFADPQRPIRLQSLIVDAAGGAEALPQTDPAATTVAEPCGYADIWFGDDHGKPQPRRTAMIRRAELKLGQCVDGPALLLEPHSTVVLEPGWRARRTSDALLLERVAPLPRFRPVSTERDPVYLEIFHNRYMAIAEQMGEALRRTARSVNVRERLDFSCAVFDAAGRLVANAPHIPVHLGSMGASVQALLARQRDALRAGDAWLINDPYAGGTHLPDLTVVSPVFDSDGGLRQLVASRAHHADVGGISPGSMPADSHDIGEEGLRFDGLRIAEAGRFLEQTVLDALSAGEWPARQPAHNVADLQAQIAANQRGMAELTRLDDEFGPAIVDAYMQHSFDHAEAAVRALASRIRGGEHTVEMDGDRRIQVSVQPQDNGLLIDFTGTSTQDPGNFNAPLAVTRAAVLYVLRLLLAEDIPLNDGCLVPITLRIPDGSLLNPRAPAAVVAGNVETSQCVVDALLGACGAQAASQGTMNNLSFGDATHQYYETICGGAGAGPDFDGASAVQTHMTNSRITDPEILESRFPVRLERFAIRRGSGGNGHHRGGDGVVRELRFLAPMQVVILSNHRTTVPGGIGGGEAGMAGRNRHVAHERVQPLAGCARLDVAAQDLIHIETPGGGGYGEAKPD